MASFAARNATENADQESLTKDLRAILSSLNILKKEYDTTFNYLTIGIGVAPHTDTNDLFHLLEYQFQLPFHDQENNMNITLLFDPEFKNETKIKKTVDDMNKYIKRRMIEMGKMTNNEEGVGANYSIGELPDDIIDRKFTPPFSYYSWFSFYFFLPYPLLSSYKRTESQENHYSYIKSVQTKRPESFADECEPQTEAWKTLHTICADIPFQNIISFNRATFDEKAETKHEGKEMASYKTNLYYENVCELLWIYFHSGKQVSIVNLDHSMRFFQKPIKRIGSYHYQTLVSVPLDKETRFLVTGGGKKRTRRCRYPLSKKGKRTRSSKRML
jgi:hypothetical protein